MELITFAILIYEESLVSRDLHFLVHAIDIFARAIYCIRVIYDVVFNLNQWLELPEVLALQQCLVDP